MGLSELLQYGVMALYLASTALFLFGLFAQRGWPKTASMWCAAGGFALHTAFLGLTLADHSILNMPRSFFFKVLSWTTVLIFFVLWRRLKLTLLALTASPLAFLLFVSSLTLKDVGATMPPKLSNLFFGLHIGSIFLSFGLLAMAFGAGLLFIWLDRMIKGKQRIEGLGKELPALAAFDKINYFAVVGGFPLFTLGVISGFVWAKFTWGAVVSWDPKEITAVIIWIMYAFLFHQRLVLGWRGRKPAWVAVLLFTAAVISMAGVNTLFSGHHSFIQQP